MAGITDLQRNYLELLMKDYPEYKAGFYESTTPEPTFEDVFTTPSGPLYSVQPTKEQLESGAAYYDEGDVDVATYAPKGPLYDVDPQRSADIMESLYESGDIQAAQDLEGTFSFHDDGSLSQNIYDPGVAQSYSEWQAKDFELPEKKFAGNVNIEDISAWGETPKFIMERKDHDVFEPNVISLQKNLMDLVGTKPTSPRNEELIDARMASLGWQKPVDINRFAADVLGHEYRHNRLDMPGFEDIRDEVMGTNIRSLFAKPKSVEYLPSVYEAGSATDADEHLKEELFNEAADIYNKYLTTGKMRGILTSQNLNWMRHNLGPYFESKQKFKWGSPTMDYYNRMLPTVQKYFTEVDRQGRMGPINKAKLRVGMPEHLSFDTGASNVPAPITPRHAPSEHREERGPSRDRGRARGRGETGQIAGGHHFNKGGLIDIPLPGRSRYI